MALLLNTQVDAAIRAHGTETYPDECCGALIGRDGVVTETLALPNTTEEGPRRRFMVRPQDYREAERWFRLAAEQGEATAQVNLGLLYANGYGVAQSYVQAYRWWSRAGAQGHKDALQLRAAVAAKMTPMQITEAEEAERLTESRAKK